MSKSTLTIFVDHNIKMLLRQIAEIEDEINSTYGGNRKGVSGLLEPLITEWVEDYLDDLNNYLCLTEDVTIEDVA